MLSDTKNKQTLVGGHSHGNEININDSLDSVQVPVYASESQENGGSYDETYTRRTLSNDFGEEAECFGFSEDDDVTVDALARGMDDKHGNISQEHKF